MPNLQYLNDTEVERDEMSEPEDEEEEAENGEIEGMEEMNMNIDQDQRDDE